MKVFCKEFITVWTRALVRWISRKFDSISIDLTPVENKLDEVNENVADVKTAVENIDIDTSDLAKESTLATIGSNASTDFATIKDAVKKNGTTVIDAVNYNIQQVSNQQGYLQNTIAKEATAQAAANDAAAAKTAAQAITGYATESNATANKNAIIAAIQANAGVPILTIPDSTAAQELTPNTLYIFATRTSTLTLTLGTPIVGIANEYHFFVVCGATAPTINFPAGITWNGGSAPTIAAGKTYEVSILNNVAAYFEI